MDKRTRKNNQEVSFFVKDIFKRTILDSNTKKKNFVKFKTTENKVKYSYPTSFIIKHKKLLYKDKFVCQFLVRIKHKEYIFTQIKNKKYLLINNFETLALYSGYFCFPLTYVVTEKSMYITENKRKTLPLKCILRREYRKYLSIFKRQLGIIKNSLFFS